MDDRITLYGSFTSSSSYKPMLYLALARVAFSFRTVNLKKGVQNQPEYLAVNRYGYTVTFVTLGAIAAVALIVFAIGMQETANQE